MKRIFIFILLICALALSACGGEATAGEADGRLYVVTTIAHIADAVAIIGGEHIRVDSLMGPGTDPHLYTASARDVDKLREADIVFYNGLFLEARWKTSWSK
jgi:manganese/zinc/iron transport system substrate-binding protein